MGIEQKVAVITGASQGIGAALVKAYRDRNYRIVATARSIRPSNDDEILAVPGDIADRKTAERAISEGMARFGRIDTLVNNAGIFIAKPFTQYTEADYGAMLGVNIAGFFHITQLAVAEMEKQGSGHVVQITTSLVDHAVADVPSVLASLTKGGLAAATEASFYRCVCTLVLRTSLPQQRLGGMVTRSEPDPKKTPVGETGALRKDNPGLGGSDRPTAG